MKVEDQCLIEVTVKADDKVEEITEAILCSTLTKQYEVYALFLLHMFFMRGSEKRGI